MTVFNVVKPIPRLGKKAGETVDLTDAAAQYLLLSGHIEVPPPVPAPRKQSVKAEG